MLKKELRPHTVYFTQLEFELVNNLIILVATENIKTDDSWVHVALPLAQRLNKLTIKFKKDVRIQKEDPAPGSKGAGQSVPPVQYPGGSRNGNQ